MKLFLFSLNAMFLFSCTFVAPEATPGKVANDSPEEKSQIQNIVDQAKTALEQVESFEREVKSLESIFTSRNVQGFNPTSGDVMKTLKLHKNTLSALIEQAQQDYRVAVAAQNQAESAVDSAGVESAVLQAQAARDKVIEARDQAESIRNQVKTLTGTS